MLSFSRRLRRRRLTGTIQYADESRLLHIRHCGIGKHGDKPFYPLCMHVSSNADSTSVIIIQQGGFYLVSSAVGFFMKSNGF